MQQATQAIAPAEIEDGFGSRASEVRRCLVKGAVRTVAIVVVHIRRGHVLKMTSADDQKVVEAFVAHALDPALREPVSPRRAVRVSRPQNPLS